MDELEKIDLIRERMEVSYEEAKIALDLNEGDALRTLIYLEKQNNKWDDKLHSKGKKIVDQINEIVKKGNVTKVRLTKGEKVILEIPATLGVVGVGGMLLSPILAILAVVGTVAAFVSNYKLEIVRPDGQVEVQDLNFLVDEEDADTSDTPGTAGAENHDEDA